MYNHIFFMMDFLNQGTYTQFSHIIHINIIYGASLAETSQLAGMNGTVKINGIAFMKRLQEAVHGYNGYSGLQ